MGEVVGAGLLAHVPTIMLPEHVRKELNEGQEISLVPGLHKLRKDKFETLDYDTVIVTRTGRPPSNSSLPHKTVEQVSSRPRNSPAA